MKTQLLEYESIIKELTSENKSLKKKTSQNIYEHNRDIQDELSVIKQFSSHLFVELTKYDNTSVEMKTLNKTLHNSESDLEKIQIKNS